jgi:hypothetical protein
MPGSDARIEDRFLVAFGFDNGRVTRIEVLGPKHVLEAIVAPPGSGLHRSRRVDVRHLGVGQRQHRFNVPAVQAATAR